MSKSHCLRLYWWQLQLRLRHFSCYFLLESLSKYRKCNQYWCWTNWMKGKTYTVHDSRQYSDGFSSHDEWDCLCRWILYRIVHSWRVVPQYATFGKMINIGCIDLFILKYSIYSRKILLSRLWSVPKQTIISMLIFMEMNSEYFFQMCIK